MITRWTYLAAVLCLFFAPLRAARAQPRPAVESICTPLALATRSGTPACWARYDLGRGSRLCISRDLWVRILRERNPCGDWKGKWRTFRSPGEHGGRPRIATFYAASLSARDKYWPARGIERAREALSRLFESGDRMGILRKLLLNQSFPGGLLDFLRLLGFVHLVTAAGIHLYALARISESASRSCLLRAGVRVESAIRASRAFSAVLWIVIWVLEGMRPGMLRPFIVVLLRAAARSLGFGWKRYSPLLVALILDGSVAVFFLVTDPDRVWAAGRWHYALAVAGGLMALDGARGRGTLREHAALSIGSWLPTAVWDAATTHLIATATPLLSLLTIPLFTVFVLPVSLAISLLAPLDPWLASVAADLLGRVTGEWIRAVALASMGLRTLIVISPAGLACGVVLGGLMFWLKPRVRARWLVIPLSFLAIFRMSGVAREPFPIAGKVRQLDVGQGDAALVVFKNRRSALIDTGPGRGLSAADWIRVLGGSGVTRIDRVALTHLDEDHAGGLALLDVLVPIDRVLLSDSQLATSRGVELRRRLSFVSRFSSVDRHPGFYFRVLKESSTGSRGNRKMNAVLVRLEGGGFYLNAGDADRTSERELVGGFRLPDGAPRILKLSHHGSRGSSDPKFLDWVNPSQAWISAGSGNPHGHPTPEVTERVLNREIPLRRTDLEGDIEWTRASEDEG